MSRIEQTAEDRAAKRAKITELLPEIAVIADPRVRAAVIDIWAEMWAHSRHADVSTAPFSHKCPGVSLVEHVRAVTLAAQELARIITTIHGIEVDHELLVTACLLHDVSKLVEIGPDGHLTKEGHLFPHAYLAAEAASRASLGEEVVSLIVTHTPVVNMESSRYVEAQILEHADLASAHILITAHAQRDAGRDGKLRGSN
jgi:putative nucleotidyltransferase with HDIG domain